MRIKKIYKMAFALVLLFAFSSLLFPGDASRIGTTAGVQVQVPVGGRTLGMSGADIANTSSVDALFWNPAGLGNVEKSGSGFFSSSRIIADIKVNYFSIAMKAGKVGNIGISLKSFDFGSIPITTIDDMDGDGGGTYSPTFSTIGLSYARNLSDKINFGITGKVIYESIPRAKATTLAFDIGIQYQDLMDVENLAIGIVVQNVGGNMQYTGSGMITEANEEETFNNFFERATSSDGLPTSLKMGI
ncbi:MAG: PorV/PorQ family protein, partial [Candidatus Marinimicrobia bacterium]|nr:PorV/PorQ family protein [Candidatus Neomarinimicrobiota bacterium]